MEMHAVKSSQIEEIGHDAKTNTMAVKFHGGAIYHYHDVSPTSFNALKGAKSVGAHFGQHIKAVKKFTKLQPPGKK